MRVYVARSNLDEAVAPCLLINEMGPHPSGLLYGYIAESIGERVLSALGRVSTSSR